MPHGPARLRRGLLTDELTDGRQVPLWISTSVFAVLLGAVFASWYARERTLSIHSIVTLPREAYYWLAYILARPLGANLGDFLASSRGRGGLGLGTFGTSALFLGAILIVVAYLTKTGKDQAELARPKS